MQGLASYGSDSESDDAAPVAGPSRLVDHHSAGPVAPRLKSTQSHPSSRSHTPSLLPGVKKLYNDSPASTRGSPAPSLKRRASSASPPPYSNLTRSVQVDELTTTSPPEAMSLDGIQINSLSEFGIPPMLTGPADPAVQAKLANFHHLALTRGLHFNDSLSASKAFRNPRVYAKLVEFVGVDESGSNWDKKVWDPMGLGEVDSHALAALRKGRPEKRDKEKEREKETKHSAPRSKIAFTAGAPDRDSTTTRKSESSSSRREWDNPKEKNGAPDRKKSRWDSAATGGLKRERSRSRSPRRR